MAPFQTDEAMKLPSSKMFILRRAAETRNQVNT